MKAECAAILREFASAVQEAQLVCSAPTTTCRIEKGVGESGHNPAFHLHPIHWESMFGSRTTLQCAEVRLIDGQREMKRIAKFVLLVGSLGAAFLLGQNSSNFDKWWTPENDALVAAPQNHKLLFENDEVRVLEVRVPPGIREPLHAHRYPSVLYYVSAAHMKEYSPGLAAVDRGHKKDGAVIFLPIGPPHQMENMEETKSLKAIRVELKNAR